VINDIKAAIRPFIPSPLYRAAHSAKRLLIEAPPLPQSFSPRSSFADAEREAGIGYGNEAILTKAHIGRINLIEMPDYVAPLLASVSLAAQDNNRLRILDFGGGQGAFRAYVNDFFKGRIQTHWKVVETPAQVRFNNQLDAGNFEFATEIGSEPFDLAIFSGSLQYIDDWQGILRSTNARMIFIARTPLGGAEQPFVQSVAKSDHVMKFAGRVIDRSELTSLLSKTHELFTSWSFESHLLEMGKFPSPAMLWVRT